MHRFIRAITIIALLAAPLAGCVSPGAELTEPASVAGVDAAGFAPRVFAEGFSFGYFDVAVDPTLSLHAETFLPLVDEALTPEAPETFPTILVMSPYFGSGQAGSAPGHAVYGFLVNELVPRGYAVVLADTAGTGGSSGCWDFMGPNEVRGVAAMIDAIAQMPWSDGKVGMIGKSYDGMTQIMATATNPEALKTIVPVAPLTHAYAGLYMNGIHYGGGWHATTTSYHQISATPPVDAIERMPGYAVRTIETPTCIGQNTALGNDPSGAYNSYFVERDFRPMASEVAPSVLYMQGFLDPAVKPDNMFPWFNDVPGVKKAWIGHWEHDYPNAQLAGRTDMYATIQRWFDSQLKGIDNGILDEPVFDVQDSQGRWRHEATWPPADGTSLGLYLGGERTLTRDAGESTAALPFGGPEAYAALASGEGAGSLRFPADASLSGPLHIAGVPSVALKVSSDRPGGYVVVKLIEETDAGDRLVSQGAMSLLVAGDLASPSPATPGQAIDVAFDLYPTDYAVRDASRLVVELSTVDAAMWFDPDPFLSTLTVSVGQSDAPHLTLPLVERGEDATFLVACGSRIADFEPACFDETREDALPSEASA